MHEGVGATLAVAQNPESGIEITTNYTKIYKYKNLGCQVHCSGFTVGYGPEIVISCKSCLKFI
jgi:hypothetical protein